MTGELPCSHWFFGNDRAILTSAIPGVGPEKQACPLLLNSKMNYVLFAKRNLYAYSRIS